MLTAEEYIKYQELRFVFDQAKMELNRLLI